MYRHTALEALNYCLEDRVSGEVEEEVQLFFI
jgi:hypothetical protein